MNELDFCPKCSSKSLKWQENKKLYPSSMCFSINISQKNASET